MVFEEAATAGAGSRQARREMTPDGARAELVASLVSSGALDRTWRPAFEQVPRHLFIPDTIWQVSWATEGRLLPLHRDVDPDRWLTLAYRNGPVDTQVDDGRPADDGSGYEVTSSASQPSVVAEMLSALAAQPGMRVLEIGTGTGWNAALLAHRLGAENVVTVEVDPAVAGDAAAALDRAGFGKVTVITGDGCDGWVDGAPYDRVIATAGASTVPYPWVEQTVPGGRIVVPLANTYQAPGIAVLTVDGHGTASGRLAGPAVFMDLRSQRVPRPRGTGFGGEPDSVTSTELHPYRWAGDRAAATAIGQRLGQGVHTEYDDNTATTGIQWLLDPDTGSWAAVHLEVEPPYPVRQAGSRRLFDEVATAYRWWLDAGKPPVEAWSVTVGPEGQSISRHEEPSGP